ncbi:MAG: hypothetical protein EOP24_39680 [Hyphomicrobiales bacterium]|nr:MAG: hypothetical protein EOP24_39680 [Hyphomicrobiales bacterium]
MSFRNVYGYTYSENGWRMCNRDACVVANVLPFTNTAPIRAGDAATILNAWTLWYHHNVEPLTSPVWGWSATNDVANSNHLSGTALDFNAPKYPWGLRTMPAARIAKIREGLRLFEGTVFWGADWGRADEMHFQIGYREGDARVRNFAQRLSDGHLGIYGPPKPAPVPVANEIDIEAKVAAAWIGKRLHDGERPCKDGIGRYADFENGSIYWHPNVADGEAIAVPTAVYETWKGVQWEQGQLGYPTQRHKVIAGAGDVQAFQGGAIYRRPGQPGRIVHGAILKFWASLGYENSAYGWPTSNEYETDGGGRAQSFDRGVLRWHPSGVIGELTKES